MNDVGDLSFDQIETFLDSIQACAHFIDARRLFGNSHVKLGLAYVKLRNGTLKRAHSRCHVVETLLYTVL